MSKVVLTDGQRARIAAQLNEWGGLVTDGLREMYESSLRGGEPPEDAAWMTDVELAWRMAWLRKARITPADKPVIVTPDEVERVLEAM